jgi:hypothetical protein
VAVNKNVLALDVSVDDALCAPSVSIPEGPARVGPDRQVGEWGGLMMVCASNGAWCTGKGLFLSNNSKK